MRISELIDFTTRHIQAGNHVPLWVWGPPGIGKSDAIRQVAKNLGMRLIDRRAVTFDSVDVRGVPTVKSHVAGYDYTDWAIPGFLRNLDDGVPTIVFWDELAQAAATVQAALLQLTLDRRIDEFVMPDNVVQIAASNRQQDKAGVGRVITPLLNRFVHIDLAVNNDDWMKWAVNAGIDVTIRAFINFRPALLLDFDANSSARGFPSPRSWAFADSLVKLGLSDGMLHEVLSGTIGAGAASEYVGFRNAFTKIPDVNQIKSSPGSAPVPTVSDPDVCYALVGKLSDLLRQDTTWTTPYCDYIVRLPKEFAALAVRDGMVCRQGIVTNPTITSWIRDNASLINAEV